MEGSCRTATPTHRPSRIRRRLILVSIFVPILLWVAGWWGLKHVFWWTPDGHNIARAVQGAATVNEALLTPPQAYRNVRITAAEMSALSGTAQTRLADYYTGSLLSDRRVTARQVLNPRDLHWGKTTDWMTWWRVDWVHLGELTLLPGSATANATASMEVRSNGGDISRMDYTFHLAHSAVGWRVDQEQSEFELGYGP